MHVILMTIVIFQLLHIILIISVSFQIWLTPQLFQFHNFFWKKGKTNGEKIIFFIIFQWRVQIRPYVKFPVLIISILRHFYTLIHDDFVSQFKELDHWRLQAHCSNWGHQGWAHWLIRWINGFPYPSRLSNKNIPFITLFDGPISLFCSIIDLNHTH